MQSSFHIETRAALERWAPLLGSWVAHVNQYCVSVAGGNPYWYGEQANVAFLMGAAFPLDQWSALTEFSSAKEGIAHTYGRNDAWLYDGQSEYYVEAKHQWVELEREDGPVMVQAALANAEANARLVVIEPLELSAHVYRVALVFICPRYPATKTDEPDRALLRLQEYLRQQCFDALAWTFTESTYRYRSQRTNRYYPGVMLVARVVEQVR